MKTASRKKSKTKQKLATVREVEREFSVDSNDSKVLLHLAGARDYNLKTIERELEVRIGHSNGSFVVTGQASEVDLTIDLLSQLAALIASGEQLFPGDVERAIKMLSGDRHLQLAELFRDQVKISGRTHAIVPKTFTQKRYIESIAGHDIVFGIGPAGTGKTYLAMAMAISAFLRKEVKRVILCRLAVDAGLTFCFLTGDMAEKVNPYLRPLYDALHDMVDYDRAKELVERGQIEV
ncbi:MAG: PhoH family protein, partial [Bdellovibrionales bacterium]|nr:PhoH family protein [Bdellovibrionales bacterium]